MPDVAVLHKTTSSRLTLQVFPWYMDPRVHSTFLCLSHTPAPSNGMSLLLVPSWSSWWESRPPFSELLPSVLGTPLLSGCHCDHSFWCTCLPQLTIGNLRRRGKFHLPLCSGMNEGKNGRKERWKEARQGGGEEGSKEGNIIACECLEKKAPLSPPLPSGNPDGSTLAREPQKKKSSTRRQRCFWLWLWQMPLTPGWASVLTLNGNKTKGRNRSVVNEVWGSRPRSHSSLWREHHCQRRIPGLWEGSDCSYQELMLSATPPPAASPGLRVQSQMLILQSQLRKTQGILQTQLSLSVKTPFLHLPPCT